MLKPIKKTDYEIAMRQLDTRNVRHSVADTGFRGGGGAFPPGGGVASPLVR